VEGPEAGSPFSTADGANGGPLNMRKPTLFTLVLVFGVSALASDGLSEDKEAKDILQLALKAVGGERNLARLKSPMMWMERGTFHGMGQEVAFVGQYAARWPDWYRQEIENAFAVTVSGDKAWVSTAAGIQKLVGPQLEERVKYARLAWAERLFPLAEHEYKLSRIDGIQVDGRSTVGFKASHVDQRDMKFFFDQETYLIAKIETMVVSPQHGPDPVLSEAFYSDHKSFGGVKMPSKLKLFYEKKLFIEAETIDYKMGATLDPKHFEAPE
jgi:hypothetical protein